MPDSSLHGNGDPLSGHLRRWGGARSSLLHARTTVHPVSMRKIGLWH